MKKTLYSIAAILGTLLFAGTALAATSASFYPNAVGVEQALTFTVVVTVNPNGAKDLSEKIQLNFPASQVEFVSFTQASDWLPLTQSGDDAVDTTNGTVTKTAEYPGGLTSAAKFGTFTFEAKAVGNGKITLGSGSEAFGANGGTPMTGDSTTVYVTPGATIDASNFSSLVQKTPSTTINNKPADTTPPPSSPVLSAPTQQNAVPSSSSSQMTFSTKTWYWIFGILILLIAIWSGYKSQRKNKTTGTAAADDTTTTPPTTPTTPPEVK